jgi:MFS family permease
MTNLITVYYLPVWFQAIKGVEPVQSGIRLLPLVMAFSIAAIMGGFINQKIGYYTALAILGSCIMSIGAGLLTTLHVDTSNGKWIGYQILCGFGMGLCFQTPNLATQTVLPKKEVPMGIALMFFGQLLGAAIFVSVGENVLSNQLLQRLSGVPGFDVSLVTSGSATALIGSAPPDQKGTVLVAYNDSLRKIFQIGLILSCLSVLGTVSLEWKNILKQPEAPKPEAPRPEASVSAEKSEAAEEKKIGQTV